MCHHLSEGSYRTCHLCTGHEGYLVGGAVRDLLLQSKPKDFDILTTATPVQVAESCFFPFLSILAETCRQCWVCISAGIQCHSVELQVKRLFGNCRIIGKRFPIVHVFADGACLEVSSFGTRANRELIPPDAAAFLPSPFRHNLHYKVSANPRATQRQSRYDCEAL